MLPDRIVLCGFMGAGKTRVGIALAAHLGYTFIDLDEEIEQQEGRTIAAIFASAGESAFRETETAIACKLLQENKIVLALGGGAVTSQPIMAAVDECACLIYLRATPDILWQRIKGRSERPLIANVKSYEEFLTVFNDHMTVRRPLYEQAAIIVDSTATPVDDTVSRLIQRLQEQS